MRQAIIPFVMALAAATPVAAQLPDPGQPQNSATTDWAAAKAQSEAETAAYNAAAAASKAKTAMIEAQVAAQKAEIGSVSGQSAIAGEVTDGTGTGKAEAMMLVSKASRDAGDTIYQQLKTRLAAKGKTASKIVILTDMNQLTLADLLQFEVQLENVQAQLTAAEVAFQAAQRVDPGVVKPLVGDRSALTAAGAILDTTSKLGSYFLTNYKFAAVEPTTPANLAAAAVASSFLADTASTNTLIIPDLMVTENAAALSATLKPVETRYAQAVGLAAQAKSRAAALRATNDEKAKIAAVAYDGAEAMASKAVTAHEALLSALSTTAAGQSAPIVRIARQKLVRDLLTRDTLVLLLTKTDAGAYYTKKNLWTFFGGPPVYTMGGVSLTYVLSERGTGDILASGVVVKHGGYQSVSKVQDTFK